MIDQKELCLYGGICIGPERGYNWGKHYSLLYLSCRLPQYWVGNVATLLSVLCNSLLIREIQENINKKMEKKNQPPVALLPFLADWLIDGIINASTMTTSSSLCVCVCVCNSPIWIQTLFNIFLPHIIPAVTYIFDLHNNLYFQ